jgi:hypothetical protein
MSLLKFSRAALLASVFSVPLGFAAQAADLIIYSPEPMADQLYDLTLPAVSGPNGKIEFAFGGISDPDTAFFRAGGSFSMPIGHAFGFQADVAVQGTEDDWAVGGALHLFTRDPSAYLLGVTAGVVVADGVSLVGIGPEAELYLGNLSFEAWAGWARADYDNDDFDEDGFFAFADLGYYVTDDWRIGVGVATILGENSLKLATEYQFAGLGYPISATGELRAYDNDRFSAKIGLKGYFGEPGKSLIDRHRQDDPPNRVFDLFSGMGNAGPAGPPDLDCYDNETPISDGEGGWECPYDPA